MDDTTITVGLLISYVVLDQYVFRFQRTTRGITQQIGGGMSSDLPITLTPGWVGALGWISKILMLAAGFMVWRTWGWIPLFGFALYAFVLGSFVDVISPFPTYGHCFRSIERVLQRDGQADLLQAVHKIKSEYVD